MASLEDKLLGDGKRENYCSDSDEEKEVVRIPMGNANPGKPVVSSRSGPKGVLGDFSKASDLGELALEVGGDAFLDLWREKELKEMKSKEKVKSPVGTVKRLVELSKETFSNSIENNEPNTVMIIHLYGSNNVRCVEVTKHLNSMSLYYPQTKFCQVDAKNAGELIHDNSLVCFQDKQI